MSQKLTATQREVRVHRLIGEAHTLLDAAIAEHITDAGKRLAGVVILFSGGNDSTVLAHMMRERATHAAHANTGIGIEATRQFVRDTCEQWGLPLIERGTPRPEDTYKAHILKHGFPGPGMHGRIYQRLKERALRVVVRELKTSHKDRVVFIAGRRRDESKRRADVPAVERRGATIWVSPLVEWTQEDLNTYRLMHRTTDPVPVNETANIMHMSGECLCGCFAKPDERREIAYWFPDVDAEIRALEESIANADHIAPACRTWGWGAYPEHAKVIEAITAGQLTLDDLIPDENTGPLCSDCRPPADPERSNR